MTSTFDSEARAMFRWNLFQVICAHFCANQEADINKILAACAQAEAYIHQPEEGQLQ